MAVIKTLEYRLAEFEVKVISNAIMSDTNEVEATVIAKAIKKAFPNGGIVINTASSSYNKYLFKSLYNESLTYENGYDIFNIFLTEKDVQSYGVDTNVYIVILFIICIVNWIIFNWLLFQCREFRCS